MVKQSDAMLTFSSQIKRSLSVSGYKVRFTDDASYTYCGSALPGSATSSALWMIKRINNSTGDIDFADGNLKFDNIFDNCGDLTYS